MSKSIVVTFSLPRYEHSKNHSAGWREKRKLWAAGRDVAIRILQDQYPGLQGADDALISVPFRLNIHWKYMVYIRHKTAQPYPDLDNALARCSHLLDAMQHVGLIANDNLLRQVAYETEEVETEEEREVILTLRPIKRYDQ